MKPKEWWITWNFTGSLAGVTEDDRTSEYMTSVHVIEKSAYDALAAELLEVRKSSLELFLTNEQEVQFQAKQNAKLRTENERLKLMGTRTTYAALAEENNELRTANAELVEALESVKRIQNLESVKTLATMIVTEALAKHGGGKFKESL